MRQEPFEWSCRQYWRLKGIKQYSWIIKQTRDYYSAFLPRRITAFASHCSFLNYSSWKSLEFSFFIYVLIALYLLHSSIPDLLDSLQERENSFFVNQSSRTFQTLFDEALRGCQEIKKYSSNPKGFCDSHSGWVNGEGIM